MFLNINLFKTVKISLIKFYSAKNKQQDNNAYKKNKLNIDAFIKRVFTYRYHRNCDSSIKIKHLVKQKPKLNILITFAKSF